MPFLFISREQLYSFDVLNYFDWPWNAFFTLRERAFALRYAQVSATSPLLRSGFYGRNACVALDAGSSNQTRRRTACWGAPGQRHLLLRVGDRHGSVGRLVSGARNAADSSGLVMDMCGGACISLEELLIAPRGLMQCPLCTNSITEAFCRSQPQAYTPSKAEAADFLAFCWLPISASFSEGFR